MTENVPAAANTQMSPSKGSADDAQLPSSNFSPATSDRSDLIDKDDIPESRMHPLVAGFNKLTMARQFGLLVGLAASIALGLSVVLWSQKDTYRPLMNSTNSFDARGLIEVLQANKLEFDIDPASGVILVKQTDLHAARLAVAGAGLSDDQTVGYELLDESQPLGQSQFMENARYLRSLEGELARTIASINQVKTARVHLAIPKRSVFVRDQREPTASVFTELYASSELDKSSVKAIRNLVSTSIPELSAANVSIVDQRGRLLSDDEENREEELTNRQFDYQRKVEDNLLARVNSILGPIIGSDKFQAEVTADIDFTKVEQSEELFNPDLIAIRSEQTVNEQMASATQGGIPGALTNQPPTDATAPETLPDGTAANTTPISTRDEATRNYEVDRTLSFTQFQQGRVRRLTVAVVVDDLSILDPDTGEFVEKEWDDAAILRLRTLVQDAVGYDVSRGDSINVINSTFREIAEVEVLTAFYEQPWFWVIVKQVLAGIFVLILLFGLLRPAIRNLLAKGTDEQDESAEDAALANLDVDEYLIADDRVSLNSIDDFSLMGPSESFERQLEVLRGLIAEDPARVALVLQQWITSDD
ncbi:MAG: flagellar M-ring protein FliF [Reinekea forsetii]|jgi:flagellar M-ring protein FliF|uniref:Flagellar M-ring protein n=1 Tax=Reinekea forsetii TaxID=1336806 RepID=A0A2K8KPX2_9GAMM|nr:MULTISPECIES: flagellar basal-body MS-ring/collar protein FliF [Reinekea]ATX76662.1 flagellar M-ring protein FliF [Reinekea forsetii]MDO7644528.1 flagellar M-ring protein FliF [Reinekea forsetii]MDO7673224.1 flagellar M-ring protein FliF [Reinekea forsetii]